MDFKKYLSNIISFYFSKNINKQISEIKEKTNYKEIFLILIAIAIIGNVLELILTPQKIVSINKTILLLIIILIIPISIILTTYLNNFFLKLFKGKSNFKETLKFSNSISILPLLFSILLLIITNIFFNNNALIIKINYFLIFLVNIYLIIINIRVLAKIHKVSYLKSFFAYILTIISAILIIIIFILIISIFIWLIKY